MITQELIKKVVGFVKQEPRTVQDLSRLISKSWVTTDKYLKEIKSSTGLINIKTFRKGTQGALKIVYLNSAESLAGEGLREELFAQIKAGKKKTDFEFFDVFQNVDDEKKKISFEEYDDELFSKKQNLDKFIKFLKQANETIHIFSGNLSFINLVGEDATILEVLHELVKRKVSIKILSRVTVSSLSNISKLADLIKKYPEYIEIKHSFQPLRGFIIDNTIARFKSVEMLKDYKPGELDRNMKIFYEVYDKDWIGWLDRVFWSMYRVSVDYNHRITQLKKYF